MVLWSLNRDRVALTSNDIRFPLQVIPVGLDGQRHEVGVHETRGRKLFRRYPFLQTFAGVDLAGIEIAA